VMRILMATVRLLERMALLLSLLHLASAVTGPSSFAVVHTPGELTRALAPPHVNVVVLERAPRDRSGEAERWQIGEQRMELTVGAALGDGGALRDLVLSGLPSVRGEPCETICELVRLFAHLVTEVRGAQPGESIRLRWQVSRWREGGPRCSRFHEDHVALRMVSALSGEGTAFLPERLGRRVGMRAASSAPLLSPDCGNALVCAPWERPRRVKQDAVLLLKGRRWGPTTRAAIHRSPDITDDDGDPLPSVRALFSADFLYPC
jgi:hypothetical protein